MNMHSYSTAKSYGKFKFLEEKTCYNHPHKVHGFTWQQLILSYSMAFKVLNLENHSHFSVHLNMCLSLSKYTAQCLKCPNPPKDKVSTFAILQSDYSWCGNIFPLFFPCWFSHIILLALHLPTPMLQQWHILIRSYFHWHEDHLPYPPPYSF